MLAPPFRNKLALSSLAGLCVILACPPISFWPFIFLMPSLLNALAFECRGFRDGFSWGFFTSFVIMGGVFYWVTYVIHVFGYLPWTISVLLYLGFCGFGALNFPLFTGLAAWLQRRIQWDHVSPIWTGLWFAAGLPALFTVIEFSIPKLFPWFISHTLYRQFWLTQTAEIAGTSFSTFAIYSLGSVVGHVFLLPRYRKRPSLSTWIIPFTLWLFTIGFSWERIQEYHPDGEHLEVALVQANIGSLEKRAARKGIYQVVEEVLNKYESLTDQALKHSPRPNLIVWPETAIPFQIEHPGHFSTRVLAMAQRWNIPFIAGAYAPVPWNPVSDFNAAYLLEPQNGKIIQDVYRKNVLLAFGEYMPLGDLFPQLYQWFPAVSHFAHGTEQNPFTLQNGVRLGVTICYEAIIPSFFRRVAQKGVVGVINLTNDSWFGPTSEPYQHAALSVFRSIETRLPLIRVTNTGISFTVDALGRMSDTTGVYEEGILNSTVDLPRNPPQTLYLEYGDWFIYVCTAFFIALIVAPLRRKHNASISI